MDHIRTDQDREDFLTLLWTLVNYNSTIATKKYLEGRNEILNSIKVYVSENNKFL